MNTVITQDHILPTSPLLPNKSTQMWSQSGFSFDKVTCFSCTTQRRIIKNCEMCFFSFLFCYDCHYLHVFTTKVVPNEPPRLCGAFVLLRLFTENIIIS